LLAAFVAWRGIETRPDSPQAFARANAITSLFSRFMAGLLSFGTVIVDGQFPIF